MSAHGGRFRLNMYKGGKLKLPVVTFEDYQSALDSADGLMKLVGADEWEILEFRCRSDDVLEDGWDLQGNGVVNG